MTIREAWEKKKAAQADSGQAAARSGDTVEAPGQQSSGGIKIPLAAIFAALATFSKKAAEKLRQKHKGNDGRSQTPEESDPILGGCGFGLASEAEEQEETGGSRIALLILLASITALALWASDYTSDCKGHSETDFAQSPTNGAETRIVWTEFGNLPRRNGLAGAPIRSVESSISTTTWGKQIATNLQALALT